MRAHWLVSLMVVAGCAVDGVAVSESEHQIGGTSCPPWLCENSPETLLYKMHDLHLAKELNVQGYRLEFSNETGRALIFKFGQPYELYIDDGRITAVGYGMKLMGQALLGAEMHVLDANNTPVYYIRIERVSERSFGVEPKKPLEVYKLTWKDPSWPTNATGKRLCRAGIVVEEADFYGMLEDEALIFVGDRIDSTELTITPEPSNLWMSFGCAGHTLAKLHMTHNTTSSNIVDDPQGNQATLKMFAAAYCGDGRPWTISGTPIRWFGGPGEDYGGNSVAQIEARWNADGATCLSEPRIQTAVPPYFDALILHKRQIRSWCKRLGHPLPKCTNADPYDLAGAKRVSALPH